MIDGFEILCCGCNHQEQPLGLDRVPFFWWKMHSHIPSDRQSAYQIAVATDAGLLEAGKQDVWSSGKIEGDQNVSIPYGGQPLLPRTRYFWRVTAWNSRGDEAKGPVNFFETGKLDEPWKAKWIGAPFLKMDKNDGEAPYFRKSFQLRGEVEAARLYICGLGYYEAYIEGERVSQDLLEPAFTKYDSTCCYRVYDVAPLLPHQGSAALGVVLGNGWYNCITEDIWNIRQASWRALPKMICELHIAYRDGTQDIICSDTSWKVSSGAIYFNSIRNGEYYNANREIPRWSEAACDDTAWENAVVVRGSGGRLTAAEIQPIRVTDELAPVVYYRNGQGNWIFDLGQNFAGKVRLFAHGPKGQEIVLRYAEELTQDGQHVDASAINGFVRSGEFQTDRYIKKGAEPEEWSPAFVYHGFRYVEVSGLPENLPEGCITGLVMHTAFERTGHFTCSDETLNAIQRLCHWSSISNSFSVPTDCPHREKNAWTGDAGTVFDQFLLNYDSFLFWEKWLNDLCQSQRPDGAIPCVCPSTGWGYNWGNGPDWSMVLSTLPWALYQWTGEKAILEKYYPHVQRHFDFMDSMAVDDIVEYGIGDWCAPFDGPALAVNMSSFKALIALTDTACYYRSAELLSKMSDVLGVENPYRKKSEKIGRAILTRFADAHTGDVAGECQTSDACIVYHHLLPEKEEKALVESLVQRIADNGWHIDYGILGSKYVLNTLGEYGRTDVIYKMLTREEYPSYHYWMRHGMTTLGECWNMGGSHNHYMFSDVSAVFYRYFAGIRPLEGDPTFKRFLVVPSFTEGITSLNCRQDCPHGEISVCWEVAGNRARLVVEVPFGTQAELRVPAHIQAKENGQILPGGVHKFDWAIVR